MSDIVFENLLIHTVAIYRKVAGIVNEYNIPSETLSTVTSSESCRIDPQKERIEINVRGKIECINLIGFFKSTADIQEWDIVELDNIKYEVVGVELLYDDKELHHKEIFLKNLQSKT